MSVVDDSRLQPPGSKQAGTATEESAERRLAARLWRGLGRVPSGVGPSHRGMKVRCALMDRRTVGLDCGLHSPHARYFGQYGYFGYPVMLPELSKLNLGNNVYYPNQISSSVGLGITGPGLGISSSDIGQRVICPNLIKRHIKNYHVNKKGRT